MATTQPKARSLSIRLTAEDGVTLDRLSQEKDVPAATIVRWALREYAERHLEKPKKKPKK